MIKVTYDGGYPNLCRGTWEIKIDEKIIRCTGEMNTESSYSHWSFGDDWTEEWDSYQDGLPVEKWIQDPPEHLVEALKEAGVDPSEKLLKELYPLIQKLDFRHLSCGGCI